MLLEASELRVICCKVKFGVGLSIRKVLWLHNTTQLERTGVAQPHLDPQAFALLGSCPIVLSSLPLFAPLFLI